MTETNRKVLVVTGAAGSLGAAIAVIAMEAGHDCILIDRDRPALERLHDHLAECGAPPALYPLDLAGASPDDYQELAAILSGEFGHIDGLVHAAADFVALRPLEHQPPDEWMKILQAGLTGPFLLTTALLPLLRAAPDRGRVVWVVDDPEARRKSYWGAYGVVQSGQVALAGILKSECRTLGPAVELVDPGAFRSPLRGRAWPAEDPEALARPETAARRILETLG